MSTKYRVEFRQVHDQYELSPPFLAAIDALIEVMDRKVDWQKDPCDFVLRNLPAFIFPNSKPFNYSASERYLALVGVKRGLTKDESDLCTATQGIVDACADGAMVRKVIGTIFERYVLAMKRREFGTACAPNANVQVRGGVVTYNNYRTVDIGIDLLDSRECLEVDECGISIRTFCGPGKKSQVDFYAEVLKEVRSEVSGQARLRFEVIAAHSGGKRWQNLLIEPVKFRPNGVAVFGRTVIDKDLEQIV